MSVLNFIHAPHSSLQIIAKFDFLIFFRELYSQVAYTTPVVRKRAFATLSKQLDLQVLKNKKSDFVSDESGTKKSIANILLKKPIA